MDVFDLFAKISLDTSEYENALNDASGKTSSFGDTLKSIGSSVSGVGTTLTNSVSRPLLDIGKNMLQAGMEYEAGMDEVAAISGATGTEIEALGEKAMEMAAKTKFSTAESAEAYKYMAMAGWETGDMLNALDAVMYLAGASGESLASTSDIVTDAMTAFGLAADGSSKVLKNGYEVEVSNAQRFTDVLAAASNNANTNVSMMGESFKYVAPVAGAMGYSIEDVAIALGLMANNGIKASMGGTALRTLLTNMASPTDTMKSAMDALGVSLEDDSGQMYSLMEVMEQLRAGFNGGSMDSVEFAASLSNIETAFEDGELSEEEYEMSLNELAEAMYGVEGAQNAQLASMLAGKYGMAGILSIVNATDEDFQKLAESIYNSNGATEEMYNIMTDNAQGAVTMLDSAINVLYTSLSQHIIPIFTDVVRAITDVVNWFGQLDDGTQKLILTIGGIAIAAGPVLTVIGNIITAVGTISSAVVGLIGIVGNVGTAVSGLFSILAANPIALVIAAVAALVAGLVVLWNTNEDFRNAVGAIWEAITGVFQAAVEKIMAAWEGVKAFFSGVWEAIQSAFSGVAEFFGGIFQAAADMVQSAWSAVVDFFSGVWEGIQRVFSTVAEVLGGVFSAAWEAVKTAWSAVTEFFSGVWEGIKNVFSSVAETLGGFFKAAWEAIQSAWSGVVDFFSGIWSGIQGVFSVVAEVLGGFFSAAWAVVQSAWAAATEFFSGIADGIRSAFETATQFLGEAFSAAWGIITGIWGAAVEFFSGIWSGITSIFGAAAEWFGSIFSAAWGSITSAWGGVKEFFSGVWESITGVFSGALDFFKGVGSNIISGLWDGIQSKVAWVKEKVSGVVTSIKNLFTGASGFDEHSPSKWANQVFRYVMEGGVNGLDEGSSNLFREVDSIVDRVKTGMDFGVATVDLSANYSGYRADGGLYNGSAPSQGGGDTYNFYSPEALDPVSAAREMKKAKQQVALGLVGG